MTDLDILRQIKKKYGKSIKELPTAEFDEYKNKFGTGYTTDGHGNITQLWIDGFSNKKIGPYFKKLPYLTTLVLRRCEFTDISALAELRKLTKLDLSGNDLRNISVLAELRKLTKLDLSYGSFTDISVLAGLQNLTSLNLSGNNLTDISDLAGLQNLTSLDLSGNNLTDISDLAGLQNLTSLSLASNKLTDISVLAGLQNLTELYLNRNNLTDLSALAGLTKLTKLNLIRNRLTNLSVLAGLTNLIKLDLSGNNLTDISVLAKLQNLTELSLSWNRLTDLSALAGMTKLTELDSRANQITSPPPEVIEQGPEAIRSFFEQAEVGLAPIYEARALIVGQPGAGKTSLRRKLIDPDYVITPLENKGNNYETTLGVEVEKDWSFPFCEDQKVTFHASLWDFGGQDIQYMTHQYFLGEKSLYILIADERKQNTQFEYWFNIIQLLGGGSPVLVVLNKCNGVAITSYKHGETCKAFPELKIEHVELDMAKEEEAFVALRKKIQIMLCNLPHVKDELPKKWPLIRDELDNLKKDNKDHITYSEFVEICKKPNIDIIKEEHIKTIDNYLHALGTIIHYRDDDTLHDLLILNPNWVVDALYTALSDDEIKKNKGAFTREWIYKLWKNPKKEGKRGYTENECRHLLNLMKKERFELCYELDRKGEFISPQLLPETRTVEYKKSIDFKGSLDFRFRYSFMPRGIMSRLIVRQSYMLKELDNEQLAWRYGAVFERDGCIAEVVQSLYESSGHKEIAVRVVGSENRKKELLTIISNDIEAIHRKSFKHVKYDVMIPCVSEVCGKAKSPNFFALEDLRILAESKKAETFCMTCRSDVSILKMLEGVTPNNLDYKEDILIMEGGAATASKLINDGKLIINIINKNEATSTATAESIAHAEATVILNEFKGLQNILDLIKEDLLLEVDDEKERKRLEGELDLVRKAGEELPTMSKDEAKSSRAMDRLKNFIEKTKDTSTSVGKVIDKLESGAKYVGKLATLYNKVSDWCGGDPLSFIS